MKLPKSFALRTVATPDSKFAVSADFSGNLALWNIDTQKQMRTAWANPPNLDERIKQNVHDIAEAEKKVKASLAPVESSRKSIEHCNNINKQLADTKNKIKSKQDKINKLRGQLGKLKGDERKKVETEIASEDKAKKALEKQYPVIIKEANKLKSLLPGYQKALSERTKVHQANIDELNFLKKETIRWQAEKVNVERHKVIGEINKLTEEELNAKATRESLKFVIADNLKKADELKKLGDKIEKAENEDEALDTLVDRFETQVRLKKDSVDSEKKIEELKVRESDIKKSLPVLKEKEKKILGDYLKRLPKNTDREVSSK
jgi:chromosome segregation ATPase